MSHPEWKPFNDFARAQAKHAYFNRKSSLLQQFETRSRRWRREKGHASFGMNVRIIGMEGQRFSVPS